ITLGYPNAQAERALLMGVDPRARMATLKPVVDLARFQAWQGRVDAVKASDTLLDYLQRLIKFTRTATEFDVGLSPRGALAFLRSAKAWALIDGREHVIPEDLQAVAEAVISHRVSDGGEAIDHRNGG